MTDEQALAKLLKAESILKQTQAGYSPSGPRWKKAMPMLWDVRQGIQSTALGEKLARAHGLLKETKTGYKRNAPAWQKPMKLIDEVEAALHREPIPNLGPILQGDKSVLLWVPTHNTDGFPNPNSSSIMPAYDSGFGQPGRIVIAPERMKITRQSSASGADAFYASGVSGIDWWIGHIVGAPRTGVWLDKGDRISTIARISKNQGGPHLHTALDCRRLIGRELLYGGQRKPSDKPRDYTFGSPTIGAQLTAAMRV